MWIRILRETFPLNTVSVELLLRFVIPAQLLEMGSWIGAGLSRAAAEGTRFNTRFIPAIFYSFLQVLAPAAGIWEAIAGTSAGLKG